MSGLGPSAFPITFALCRISTVRHPPSNVHSVSYKTLLILAFQCCLGSWIISSLVTVTLHWGELNSSSGSTTRQVEASAAKPHNCNLFSPMIGRASYHCDTLSSEVTFWGSEEILTFRRNIYFCPLLWCLLEVPQHEKLCQKAQVVTQKAKLFMAAKLALHCLFPP